MKDKNKTNYKRTW